MQIVIFVRPLLIFLEFILSYPGFNRWCIKFYSSIFWSLSVVANWILWCRLHMILIITACTLSHDQMCTMWSKTRHNVDTYLSKELVKETISFKTRQHEFICLTWSHVLVKCFPEFASSCFPHLIFWCPRVCIK